MRVEIKGTAEMDMLKEQIKRDARRHSNKLVKRLAGIPNLVIPEIAIDAIHKEVLYASQDAYRETMRTTRNGDMKNEYQKEASGNY